MPTASGPKTGLRRAFPAPSESYRLAPFVGAELRGLLASLPRDVGCGHWPLARARGFQYAEVDPDLLRRVPGWLRSGVVEGGEELRPGRVYRYGELLVKLYGRGHPLKDRFRRSRALRSADWHARALPIRTPRPLLALEVRCLGGVEKALLVTDFVRGRTLPQMRAADDPRLEVALDELAGFLAAMHRARIFHGDLHPANLIWDGQAWVLIDLDALQRRRMSRRVILRQWRRLAAAMHADPRLRRCFFAYVRRAGWAWDAAADWDRLRPPPSPRRRA